MVVALLAGSRVEETLLLLALLFLLAKLHEIVDVRRAQSQIERLLLSQGCAASTGEVAGVFRTDRADEGPIGIVADRNVREAHDTAGAR